jgi:hypothetical protein
MSQDFATRLQLELREAARRQERRGALGRLRVQLPRPSMVAVAALAAAMLLALVLVGGLGWHREQTITAPRVVQTFSLADNIASMATGFGAVWATDPSTSELLRVDPATHEVTGRVRVTRNPVVDTGAGAVWVVGYSDTVAQPRTLDRVDPETLRVTARTRLRNPDGGTFEPFTVQVAGDEVWVLGREGAQQIDPATGRATKYIPVAEREGDPSPLDLWITRDGLVALRREGRIERYDLRTGRLDGLLPVRLGDPRMFVPTDAGLVLADGHAKLALVELGRGRIVWDRQLPGTFAVPSVLGGTVWTIANQGGGDRLYELSLRTGAIRSTTRLPEFGSVGLVSVRGRLWIPSQNGKVMIVETPPKDGG